MSLSNPRNADEEQLRRLGYEQQLHRRMSGFANYALSLSIICILAGGVTSFSQGFCAVGGAAVGIGWPVWTLLALAVAATMGQVASAFPTAGGLYHWAAILGGRGWGWATAWFNLAGLVAVLAAINRGTIDFVASFLDLKLEPWATILTVSFVTVSQGLFNHRGIGLTTRLTNFSGWWILIVAAALTIALLAATPSPNISRLWTFSNFGGDAGGGVLPSTGSLSLLFLLALLLPAYTLTGFDASAHVAEETVGAAREAPRGIVRSVLISGIFGWLMLCAVVLAMPSVNEAAGKGNDAFGWTMKTALAGWLATALFVGIAIAQYLCGLATVTSASRMAYAFARDGGLPASRIVALVHSEFRTPVNAIWLVVVLSIALTVLAPYAAIASSAAVLLYISYVTPTALGAVAYGRTWTRMGQWSLGRWYRPLAVVATVACLGLVGIGVLPPNEIAGWIVGGTMLLLLVCWLSFARKQFRGPPPALLATAGLSNRP
jgi:amino acid transporter